MYCTSCPPNCELWLCTLSNNISSAPTRALPRAMPALCVQVLLLSQEIKDSLVHFYKPWVPQTCDIRAFSGASERSWILLRFTLSILLSFGASKISTELWSRFHLLVLKADRSCWDQDLMWKGEALCERSICKCCCWLNEFSMVLMTFWQQEMVGVMQLFTSVLNSALG